MLEPQLILASQNQYAYLESLLETSTISQVEYEHIIKEIKIGMSDGECEQRIEYLKDNQRDPILHGFRYNQTDIKRKLNKL